MKRSIGIFLAYVVIVCMVTFPSVLYMTDHVIGDGGDSLQFLSFQYLAYHEGSILKFPGAWTDYWRYPDGFEFWNSYDSTLLLLVGVVLYPLLHNPNLVYNISVLLLMTVNCMLSYILFSRLMKSNLLGFAGGIMYGLSFYVIARAVGHTNLILTGVFPFFIYALIRLYDEKGSFRSFIIVSGSLSLVFLTSLQYFLMLAGSLLLAVPLFSLTMPRHMFFLLRIFKNNWLLCLLSLLSSLFIFLYFNFGRMMLLISDTISMNDEIITTPSKYFFRPDAFLHLLMSFNTASQGNIEYVVFLGFVEMLMFIIFIISVKKHHAIFIISATVLFFILALGEFGTTYMPYTFLFKILPYAGIHESSRFIITAYIGIVYGVLWVIKNAHISKTLIYVLILLVIFERLPRGYQVTAIPIEPEFIDAIQQSSSTAVLDIPTIPGRFVWYGARYDYYSLFYQKPIVDGYIHWSGDVNRSSQLIWQFKKFSCIKSVDLVKFSDPAVDIEHSEMLVSLLRNYDIRTIVLHKTFDYEHPDCSYTKKRIDRFLSLPGIEKAYESREKAVFYIN